MYSLLDCVLSKNRNCFLYFIPYCTIGLLNFLLGFFEQNNSAFRV